MAYNTKKFNGKEYHTTDKFHTKVIANQEAKRLRKQGWLARIVKETGYGSFGRDYPWAVYKRKTNKVRSAGL